MHTKNFLAGFLLISSLFLISCKQNKKTASQSGVPNHHVIITYLTTGDKPGSNGT